MTPLVLKFPLGERTFLTVAEAGPADAASLLIHARRVAGESDFLNAGPCERALTLAAQVAFLRRLRSHDAGFVLKGMVAGRLVAVLSIVRPTQPRLRHRAELGLTVRAAHWGQGIGHRMGAVAIALAKARGLRKLNLRVRADNRRAIRLYLALGFSEEGLSPRALCVRGRFFAEVMMGLCQDRSQPGTSTPSAESWREAASAQPRLAKGLAGLGCRMVPTATSKPASAIRARLLAKLPTPTT
jgi:RimJ/RimL family protein N-acetyltransferase